MIAPHAQQELTLLLQGKKPLLEVDRDKDPDLYIQVRFTDNLCIRYHRGNIITATLSHNGELQNLYSLLNSSKASLIVRSVEEKQRLMGRLFGYSEEDINDFIANPPKCDCASCTLEKPND